VNLKCQVVCGQFNGKLTSLCDVLQGMSLPLSNAPCTLAFDDHTFSSAPIAPICSIDTGGNRAPRNGGGGTITSGSLLTITTAAAASAESAAAAYGARTVTSAGRAAFCDMPGAGRGFPLTAAVPLSPAAVSVMTNPSTMHLRSAGVHPQPLRS